MEVSNLLLLVDEPQADLLTALAGQKEVSRSLLEDLRARWDMDLIQQAIELSRARTRAEKKFDRASELLADCVGVEQATSQRIAHYKAQRFAQLQPTLILDLCCGIGGDAMALAQHSDLQLVDLDPLACEMALYNCNLHSSNQVNKQCVDLANAELPRALFHIDPARRSLRDDETNSRRIWSLEDCLPGLDYLTRLLKSHPTGAIKIGPGMDLDQIEDSLPGPLEIELICDRSELVQAVLWCGDLALSPGCRRATQISYEAGSSMDTYEVSSYCSEPVELSCALEDPSAFIVQASAAIERADLLGAIAQENSLVECWSGLRLLTGLAKATHPLLQSYEICAQLPWREKKLKAWLRKAKAASCIVKSRGGAVDANQAQKLLNDNLNADGDATYIIFALRKAKQKIAIITQACATQ